MSRGFEDRIFEGLFFHLQLIGAVDKAAKIRATLETHGARYCPDPSDPRCFIIIVFPPEERRALSYRYTGKEASFNYIWTYEQICIRFARRDSGRPDPEGHTRKRVVQASWVNACIERKAFLMDNHCDKWEIVTKDRTPLPSVAVPSVPSGPSGPSAALDPPTSHTVSPAQLGPDGHFTPPPESSTLSTPRELSAGAPIPTASKGDTVLSVFQSRRSVTFRSPIEAGKDPRLAHSFSQPRLTTLPGISDGDVISGRSVVGSDVDDQVLSVFRSRSSSSIPSATFKSPIEAAKDPKLAHKSSQPRSTTLLGVSGGDVISGPSKGAPDFDNEVSSVFRSRPSPAVSFPLPKDPRLAHKFYQPRSTSPLGALEDDDLSGPSDVGSDVNSDYDSTQAPRPRGRTHEVLTRDEVQVPIDDTVTLSPPPIAVTADPPPLPDAQSPSGKRPTLPHSTSTGPANRCRGLQAAISRLNTAPRAPPIKLPGIIRKPAKPALPSVRRTSQSIKESLTESISEAIATSSLPKRPVIVRKEGDVPLSGTKRKRHLSGGSTKNQKKQDPVDISQTISNSNRSSPIAIDGSDDESQGGDSTFVQDISPRPSPQPLPNRILPLEKILQTHSFTPITPLMV